MKKLLALITALSFAAIAVAADINDLSKKANAGDAQAQYELGMAYFDGDGVDPDPVKATQWFEKAAKQGHNESIYQYGTAVFTGDGVKADKIMGCAWLYLSTVDSSEYLCLSQMNGDQRAQAKAESEKLQATICLVYPSDPSAEEGR